MPLILPDGLPAIELLKKENIFVDCNVKKGVRPLRIAFLNLMPIKITTETDIIRLLSNSPFAIEMCFMKIKNHVSKNTPMEYINRFYTDFEKMRNETFDGMIITGAPLELMDFEDVEYWDELADIFEWTLTNVGSTLHICWAAQAGLYYHYGIPKYRLPKKKFGIFLQHTFEPSIPLFRGFDDEFFMPHSRHTELHKEDIEACHGLRIIAESDESGVSIVTTSKGKDFFITGHMEYSPYTLDTEYRRDKGKRNDVELPVHYYKDDNPSNPPIVRWRAHANLLFSNWINHYVSKAHK